MKLYKLILLIISIIYCDVIVAQNNDKPKLILKITVDQLRGDLPDKFMTNMGNGGFRYLKEQGIWFQSHANTETVVGHTTLANGANPAVHGMISNVWLNRETGKLSYNIEDARYPIISEGADGEVLKEIIE